ncbi:MAG: aldehyde dehydrogenase family protein [Bacteroidia bacterium]|nr:aldehyde dehydrogenase family protein [Bacteroidia bacterium]
MERVEVLKTYKIFIGGQFPRTESGRYYPLKLKNNMTVNVSLSSRKDYRNAVVAARSAFSSWSTRPSFNRGQILYRIAEMLEGRKEQFLEELKQLGYTTTQAKKELELSIDRIVYYAGWCDKYQQMYSSVNPVASSHFNFSVPEPMGVVAILANEDSALIGLISVLVPCIAGGNTCVILASESKPTCAVTFAEVLATSDVPAGVVNILTGTRKELHAHFSSHMDVNAIVDCNNELSYTKTIQENASLNVKRVFHWNKQWANEQEQNPYFITELQEIKTTWHPIENIGVSGIKY